MSLSTFCVTVLALAATTAAAQGTSDPCGNLTVMIDDVSFTWAELAEPGIQPIPGEAASYLRPNGQALLPWLYTAIILVVHIPLVIIRVVRWETVQIWCLATTLLTVLVYAQAYASTHFSGAQVFVWTPLPLLIDAGSMAQIVFLIVEDYHLWIRAKLSYRRLRSTGDPDGEAQDVAQMIRDEVEAQRKWTSDDQARLDRCLSTPLHKEFSLYVAIMALLLLCAIVTLQLLGVVFADRAIKTDPVPTARWCSPLFRPFGVALRTGECNIYPIDRAESGIGCISLSGKQQAGWLKGTFWGTLIGIVLECVDVVILAFVNSSWRPRQVRMRRPWCTMFCGVAVLAVMLIFGIIYAQNQPPGITGKVWLVVKVGDMKPMVFSAHLATSGLRGTIIGWHDGLLGSWGPTYSGFT
ncbi:MAG: hypothetical protein M1816_005733 [Peltula sp. TS41687]|nr:MAG: hypothetical protein M1816_005733 [Peltula sp. TS41687]